MKKMMMIAGVGLMSTTLFVGCQNASPESKRIGSAAIGGGAGGAVGKHIGVNLLSHFKYLWVQTPLGSPIST